MVYRNVLMNDQDSDLIQNMSHLIETKEENRDITFFRNLGPHIWVMGRFCTRKLHFRHYVVS